MKTKRKISSNINKNLPHYTKKGDRGKNTKIKLPSNAINKTLLPPVSAYFSLVLNEFS